MADKTPDAKTPAAGKSTAKSRAQALTDRMAGLAAASEPDAGRQERATAAAARARQERPPTSSRSVRGARPMPAESPRPQPAYSARVSHTTTYDQLAALEELSTISKREGKGAVPVTSLLRAAAAICLDDARLRDRMVRYARTEWR